MLRTKPLPLLLPSLLLPTFISGCDDSGDRDRDGRPWTASRTVALEQYESCEHLESAVKERALEELDALIDSYGQYADFDDGTSAPEEGSGDGDGGSGDREEGTDYSGTNNQEEGVDEPDLVKTDGYHIYVVNGNRLHVFDVPEFGQLVPASETLLEGYPSQLLLDAELERAAVFSYVGVEDLPDEHPLRSAVAREQANDGLTYRTSRLSKISIYDVSDPAAPALSREVWVEGWLQTARRTDHSVRAVVNGYIPMPGLDDFWYFVWDGPGNEPDLENAREEGAKRIAAARLDDLIPRVYERLADGELRLHSLAGSDCGSFYYPTDSAGRSTTTILSFDLGASELAVDADTVMSNWSTVYASRDRLYLAETAWAPWWQWSRVEPGDLFVPATNIHAFDVTLAGRSSYVGSGRIDGTVLNQFSLDEEEGLLRVAATTTAWRAWGQGVGVEPPPPPESHIYVLEEKDGALNTVGHLGGIAPEESIFAARFLPGEAFLITFEQVDPLFTIDLSEPRSPRLVGELEVPGFSTYLHPIAEDRILAIGVGGDANGVNWNAEVSLFDVSNRAEPALVDSQELVSNGRGWSEAQYEHKAFQYFAPKKLLSVPMSSYSEVVTPQGYFISWQSRLELLNVDAEAGVSRYGTVDHSRFYGIERGWWGSPDVRRTIFMGDYIYALSTRALTVHRLDDLSEVAAEALPFPSDPYWWWGE